MHLLVDFASTQTSSISECEHSPTPMNSSREMRGFTVTSREETKFKQGIIQLVIYTHGDQFFFYIAEHKPNWECNQTQETKSNKQI